MTLPIQNTGIIVFTIFLPSHHISLLGFVNLSRFRLAMLAFSVEFTFGHHIIQGQFPVLCLGPLDKNFKDLIYGEDLSGREINEVLSDG